MQLLSECAKETKKELQIILEKGQAFVAQAPKGLLRISKKKNVVQFYKTDALDNTKRFYIRKKDRQIAKQLAQRDYYEKVLPYIKRNISAINSFLRLYNHNKLEMCFSQLSEGRKQLVEPIFLDDNSYASKWQTQIFESKKEQPDGSLLTMKNEPVRSKSEVIIANLLNAKNVPYHYEYPLKLKTGVVIHPDFYCLNARTRQTFYWEHFGMMDNPEYADRFVQRLSYYSQNNIFPGKNLLITTESSAHPLETRYVEKLIKNFLL